MRLVYFSKGENPKRVYPAVLEWEKKSNGRGKIVHINIPLAEEKIIAELRNSGMIIIDASVGAHWCREIVHKKNVFAKKGPLLLMAPYSELQLDESFKTLLRENPQMVYIDTEKEWEYNFAPFFKTLTSGWQQREEHLSSEVLSSYGEMKKTKWWLKKEKAIVRNQYQKELSQRAEIFENISLRGKLMAGTAIGGEFFDGLNVQKRFAGLVARTESYSCSGLVTGRWAEIRDQGQIDLTSFKTFAHLLTEDFKEHELQEQIVRTDLLFYHIDTASLVLHGQNKGEHGLSVWRFDGGQWQEVFMAPMRLREGQDEEGFAGQHFKFVLCENDRIVILSSGLKKNWQELTDEDLNLVIRDALSGDSFDFMDEIFFKLKEKLTSESYDEGLLPHDASLLLIEVMS